MVATRSTPGHEALRVELQQLVVAGRDDAVVIGEGAVDQLAGQHRAAEAEADLGRRQRDLDRAFDLVEQLAQFADAFLAG